MLDRDPDVTDRINRLKARPTTRGHGSRARYVQGCRCLPCRAANARYATHRALEQAKGRGNDYVGTLAVRLHLERLSQQGVGYKQVAKVAGVASTILALVRAGKRDNMRRQAVQRVLAVTEADVAPAALVPAGPTWKRLRWLLDVGGFTKTALARRLGSTAKEPSLQVQRDFVLARTAAKVKRVYEFYHRGYD